MYPKFSRCSQTIISLFVLCSLWVFSIARPDITSLFADSKLEEIQTNTLLVGIPSNSTVIEVGKILQDANLGDLMVEKVWPEFSIALVKVPEQSASPIIAAGTDAMQRLEAYHQALEQISAINYVEYNSMISIPTMTNYNLDEHLSTINRSSIQISSNVTSSQEVVVALIDSGFGTDKSDTNWPSSQVSSSSNITYYSISGISLLDSNFGTEEADPNAYPLWENQAERNGVPGVDDDGNGFIDDFHGWDWIDNDNIANDELGHGTAVGRAMVDLVVETSGDRNAVKLMPLRILRDDGRGEISDLVDALAYALRQDVQIANLNLVTYNSPPLAAAIDIAHAEGLLMVAAVDYLGSRRYWPAAYPETLSVLGVTKDIDMPRCVVNSDIDIAVAIEPDDGDTASFELAVPYTAAIVALALVQNPEWSNDGIKESVRAANNCENGSTGFIRPLVIEEIIESLQSPTALSEIAEPEGHNLYLPLIAR